MGNCLSFQISCDQTFKNVGGCLFGDWNYIKNLKQNLSDLNGAVEELKVKREDLLSWVKTEERKGLQRLAKVQLWLSKAEATEHKAYDLLYSGYTETEMLCLSGYCSNNLRSSYVYGKKVSKMLKDVKGLNSSKDFDVVAEEVHVPVVQRPVKPTVGLDRMLDEAWNLLMREEVGTIGIYGMGGVGKTTLLTQLNNKFTNQMNGYDIVIWVTVSREGRIARIQQDIGKSLRLHDEIWAKKEEEAKASDIYKILRRQKFVLLLDDVWNDIDLQKLGIPYPDQENNCKIAFTSRSMEVMGCAMRADAEMVVECLKPDDAWELFQRQVGEITLNIHDEIPKLARIMATKCQGLPLALTVIGGAMSCKRTVHEWHHAMKYFTKPPGMSRMTAQILPILRFSYEDLEDETVKLCFLFCALFPEDFEIEKEALIDYWIANGFIQSRSRDIAVNHGYMIIGKLVRTCLLMNDESKGVVKMHDLMHEMASWITCLSPYEKFSFILKTGTSLLQVPDYNADDLKDVRYMSLMSNQIRKACSSPNCPKLLTLFLQNNDLLDMSDDFLISMPKLVVLDLSRNYNLVNLPDMSELSSLQYLDLSHTEIKLLPSGLDKLDSLLHLNLEFTMELQDIDAVSCLKKLQVLKILGSRSSSCYTNFSRILALENLQLLTLSIDQGDCWEMLERNRILAMCIKVLSIRGLRLPSMTIQVGPFSDSLCNLEIRDSAMLEIHMDTTENVSSSDAPLVISGNPRHTRFWKLTRVEIINCRGLSHLTWLVFAPNLTQLRVVRSSEIEEIISKEQPAYEYEQPEDMLFLRLQLLQLQYLDRLRIIHWSPLLFPRLAKVVISGCPRLSKLPLHSESAKGNNLCIDAEKEWLEELEWEDDATKQRFTHN